MKSSIPNRLSGFTLSELMVSISCSIIILTALLTASVALQRSYAAVEAYSTSEGDQLRVQDYVAMDCRRATRVAIPTTTGTSMYAPAVDTGSWTNSSGTWKWASDASGPTTLILAVPNFYSSTGSVLAPGYNGSALQYGSGGTTFISYYKSGTRFMRLVHASDAVASGTNPPECGSGATWSNCAKAIATKVSSFNVNPVSQSSTNGTVSYSVMFFPSFRYTVGSGTWRSGSSAPSDGTGSNGDYYVIDTTATDFTTVGNVYYKQNGTYTLLQNVKATAVFSQTFLRNAVARGDISPGGS